MEKSAKRHGHTLLDISTKCMLFILLLTATIVCSQSDYSDAEEDDIFHLSDNSCYTLSGDGKTIISFDDSKNKYYIEIPEGIEIIGPSAFQNSHIRSVTLPSSVVLVCENAFKGCYGLNEITIENQNIRVEKNSFALGDEGYNVSCRVFFTETEGASYGNVINYGLNSYTTVDYCLIPSWDYNSKSELYVALLIFYLDLILIFSVCYYAQNEDKRDDGRSKRFAIPSNIKTVFKLSMIPIVAFLISTLFYYSFGMNEITFHTIMIVSFLIEFVAYVFVKRKYGYGRIKTSDKEDNEDKEQKDDQRHLTLLMVCWTFIGFLVICLISIQLDHADIFFGSFFVWGIFITVACLLPALLLTDRAMTIPAEESEERDFMLHKMYLYFLLVIGTCISGVAALASSSLYISSTNQLICLGLSILIIPACILIFVIKVTFDNSKNKEKQVGSV